MKQLNRSARVSRRPADAAAWMRARVWRLVQAVRQLHESEVCVSAKTYRQDPMLRMLVRDTADEIAAELRVQGGPL